MRILFLILCFHSINAFAERNFRLGGEVEVSNSETKVDANGTTSTTDTSKMNVTGIFAWNFGNFEVGPAVDILKEDSGTYETTGNALGVRGEYNFIPNESGVSLVPGIGATFYLGTYQIDYDNGDKFDGDLMAYDAFFFLKYFLPNTDWSIFGSIGTQTIKSNGEFNSSDRDITLEQTGLTVGLTGYF